MTNYSKLGYQIKREIMNFTKIICAGIKRPEFKLICNMFYGMLESNSCHLSKISRALKEEITLKKTIERLSLGLVSFTDKAALMDNYIENIRPYVDERTVFVVDGSDVTKPCSTAMEGLAIVRDGSTGELKPGYWTFEIAALTKSQKAPLPVYERVYSSKEEGFISEDDEVLRGLKYISQKFGNIGVKALDRGYDALIYYEHFIKSKEKFIIRAKKNRNVKYKDETINIMELANKFKGKYRMDFKDKKGTKRECKISVIPVSLPKYPHVSFNMVVVYGFGKNPMILLTNLKSEDKRLALTITKVYLMRWRIEEYFRFKKTQFDFEDFRVRSLNSIRTLHLITTVLTGLIALFAEKSAESLFISELIYESKRIYKTKKEKGKTKFTFYAIADGIYSILMKSTVGIAHFLAVSKPSQQLSLFTV